MRSGDLPLPALQAAECLVCLYKVRLQGALIMGDVALIVKIMPESPEVDLKALEERIRTTVPETRDVQKEPIGFGLSALKVAIIVPDSAGAPEKVEDALRAIQDVESAEIVSLTLT
jgi:elongation factor 1-beta